jgi:hypothetical protein
LLHDRVPSEYAATRVRRTISLKAIRHGNDDLWLFVMLPDAPPLSRIPPFFIPPRCAATTLTFHSSHKRVAVNAMRSNRPRPEPERARRSGGSRSERRARRSEGSGGGSTGNRGTRNTGCTSSRYSLLRRPRSTRRREREKRKKVTGGKPPLRGGSLRCPHQEPRRRQRNRHLGRARKCPQPGGLRKGWRMPRRHRRAPRRRPGALQWRWRPPPQRPSSLRGRGSRASPP